MSIALSRMCRGCLSSSTPLFEGFHKENEEFVLHKTAAASCYGSLTKVVHNLRQEQKLLMCYSCSAQLKNAFAFREKFFESLRKYEQYAQVLDQNVTPRSKRIHVKRLSVNANAKISPKTQPKAPQYEQNAQLLDQNVTPRSKRIHVKRLSFNANAIITPKTQPKATQYEQNAQLLDQNVTPRAKRIHVKRLSINANAKITPKAQPKAPQRFLRVHLQRLDLSAHVKSSASDVKDDVGACADLLVPDESVSACAVEETADTADKKSFLSSLHLSNRREMKQAVTAVLAAKPRTRNNKAKASGRKFGKVQFDWKKPDPISCNDISSSSQAVVVDTKLVDSRSRYKQRRRIKTLLKKRSKAIHVNHSSSLKILQRKKDKKKKERKDKGTIGDTFGSLWPMFEPEPEPKPERTRDDAIDLTIEEDDGEDQEQEEILPNPFAASETSGLDESACSMDPNQFLEVQFNGNESLGNPDFSVDLTEDEPEPEPELNMVIPIRVINEFG